MVKHNRPENLAKKRKEIRQTIIQASMVFYVAASHEEIVRYHSAENHFIGTNEYHDEFMLISGLRNHYLLRFNQNEQNMQLQLVVQEEVSRQHLENILYVLPNDSSSFVSLLVDTLRSSEEGHSIYREGNNTNQRGVLKKAECSSTFMEIDVNGLSKCLRETTAKFTRIFDLDEFNAQDKNQRNYVFE